MLRFAPQPAADAFPPEVLEPERESVDDTFTWTRSSPGDIRRKLAQALLRATVPPTLLQAIARREPLVVVLEAPTSAWSSALAAAVEVHPKTQLIDASRAPSKNARPETPHNLPTIAVAANVAWLAPELLSAADHHLIARPGAALVADVIRDVCGRGARLKPRDIAGLDLPDICLAIRENTSTRSCVQRLRRAAQSKSAVEAADPVPSLDDLQGFGPAIARIKTVAAEFASACDAGQTRFSPESLLFFGAPGNGKTMLARSIAYTLGVPLISTSAAEWFGRTDGHLGDVVGAAIKFFEAASVAAPCVAFIDELDSIPDRGSLNDSHRAWWQTLVTGVLLQIDALRAKRSGVLLIGATNYRECLDAALIRPGRFDTHLQIRGPDTDAEIEGVLRSHLRGDLATADLSAVVGLCRGYSAAAIAQIVRLARSAAAHEKSALTVRDLSAAAAPADGRSDAELQATALHEAGHAIVAGALGVTITHISIVLSGDAGGHTQIERGGTILNRVQLENQILILLAGRAADELLGDGAHTGARDDLSKATKLVAAVHGELGLGDRLTSSATTSDPTNAFPSSARLSTLIEQDLQRLMSRAQELVLRHATAIRALTEQLKRDRVATGADVLAHLAAERADRRISGASAGSAAP